jgi:hypothetical protein
MKYPEMRTYFPQTLDANAKCNILFSAITSSLKFCPTRHLAAKGLPGAVKNGLYPPAKEAPREGSIFRGQSRIRHSDDAFTRSDSILHCKEPDTRENTKGLPVRLTQWFVHPIPSTQSIEIRKQGWAPASVNHPYPWLRACHSNPLVMSLHCTRFETFHV